MSKEYWVISYSLFYDYWYETGGRRWLPLVLDSAQWASQWMETALVSKRQCIAGDRKRKKHKWGGKKGWYLSVDPGLQFKHAWQTRQHHQHSTKRARRWQRPWNMSVRQRHPWITSGRTEQTPRLHGLFPQMTSTHRKSVSLSCSSVVSTPTAAGPHDDLTSSTAATSTFAKRTFGSNKNIPFLFGQTFTPHPWTPPALNPSTNPFLPPATHEIKDVDMADASPGKTEENKEAGRPMALGGLKRIYNQRHKAKLRRMQRQENHSDDDIDEDTTTHNTSNHYTLNLPAPLASQPDTPYILLGYVLLLSSLILLISSRYLQFCFNLSLILLFLYLAVQFILTVQRDVEQRISEYSMGVYRWCRGWLRLNI